MFSPLQPRISFASCSVGQPKHTLHQKIEAIASAGFNGIELAFPDLLSHAKAYLGREVAENDYTALCEAAADTRKLCQRHGLDILVLQPFSNFEGWPRNSSERQDAFDRARGWIEIMSYGGIEMLQIGASDSPEISSASEDDLAEDLAQLADMMAPRGLRIAYENWCWATHGRTWRDVWNIVKRADRPNIGLCLDTFQSAGGEWGDPTTACGRIEAYGVSETELTAKYQLSLRDLARTVPKDKIYFLQISDAYRMSPPLDRSPDETGLRPRGRWSHDYRPLPYDGGYLPIAPFVRSVLDTGFRGWFSIEVFDSKRVEKYGEDLERYTKQAMQAYHKLLDEAMSLSALRYTE
jgi:sugar phosphate isomerase/epimerase